jgi:hypothetical protein
MQKLFPLVFMFMPALLLGQFQELVIEEVDNNGVVDGRTWRIYALMENPGDVIDAIYGEEKAALWIRSEKGFYQHPKGGALASQVQRYDVENDRTLRYDSWFTIGKSDNYLNKVASFPPDLSFDTFESGGNFESNNGAWFVVPTEFQAQAPSDRKILLMQLTSTGPIEGLINVHGREVPDSFDESGNIVGGVTQIQAEGLSFSLPPKGE